MHLDLSTLLLVRFCLDAFLVVFFLSFARQHAGVGGPNWWAGSAVASMLGAAGGFYVLQDPLHLTAWMVAASFTAQGLSHAFVWLGLRRFLKLPLRTCVRWVLVGAAVMFVTQLVFLLIWDDALVRRMAFVGIALGMVVVSLRDIRQYNKSNSSGADFGAITWMLRLEAVALTAVLIRLFSFMFIGPVPDVMEIAPLVVLVLTVDALVRTAVLTSQVLRRLQQEGEKARQKLQDGKADLRALIDNIHAGVIVFNPDQTIETINTSARRFLGWPLAVEAEAEEVDGRVQTNWSLLREDGRPMARHEIPFERVLATGLAVTDVMLGVESETLGEVRWALCNAFAENNAMGGLRHVVFTFVDITSLREAQHQQEALQTQLAQSQKMQSLGTLAGGVAHDFNNILAAILGNAELARQDLAPGSPVRESLHEISTAARRGRELVRQILAFSRQQPMERQRVSMRAVLAESCVLLKAAVPPEVQLDASCGPGELSVHADVTQLGQVLLNLGMNGLHAMNGQPGQLKIYVDRLSVKATGLPPTLPKTWLGVIRVRVQDNGCGMNEAVRQRIFEPFFTTRKLGTGTGLGLPVVLGIVESHEGMIEVESDLGKGSTFTLYFPAALADPGVGYIDSGWPQGRYVETGVADEKTLADGQTGAVSVQNGSMNTASIPASGHILYLDDDETLVFLVRRLLERRGYTVTSFTDQQEAIEAVRAQPTEFKLFMTDYNMPGMSGLDVARAVLALNPALPVAVASGYITDELQSEAMAAGVKEVVFKTDAVEDFCAVVARLVA